MYNKKEKIRKKRIIKKLRTLIGEQSHLCIKDKLVVKGELVNIQGEGQDLRYYFKPENGMSRMRLFVGEVKCVDKDDPKFIYVIPTKRRLDSYIENLRAI